MAAGVGFSGRKATLTIGGVGNIAIQEKSLTIDNESIDVTSDTSGGWTTLLAEAGNKSVSLGFSGIVEDLNILLSAFNNTSQIYACILTYPDGTTGSTITGDFFLGSVSNTMPYAGATTFESSMSSSGAVAFTAGT